MIRTLIAAAAIAGTATVATAQSGGLSSVGMNAGYDMLTAALMNDFERLGIEDAASKLDNLTLGQIAAIKGIADSGDDDGEKRNRINAIISN